MRLANFDTGRDVLRFREVAGDGTDGLDGIDGLEDPSGTLDELDARTPLRLSTTLQHADLRRSSKRLPIPVLARPPALPITAACIPPVLPKDRDEISPRMMPHAHARG